MASDYKEYSLNKLEEWLHDCLGAAEASPQEIYDKIKEVVQEEYYYYKNGASRTNELLQLLNGTVQFHIDPKGNKVECAIGDTSDYCNNSWTNFWEEHYYPEEVQDDGMRPWGHSDIEYLITNNNDKIKEVVQEEYYYYKNGASRTNELLQLLNGTVQFHIDPKGNKVECAIGDTSDYCNNSWTNFWEEHYYPEEVQDDGMRPWGHSDIEYLITNNNDKVAKWQLPVEIDAASEEYYVSFPDDLLEAANLKEGDKVEWVDNNDGTYTLKKAN